MNDIIAVLTGVVIGTIASIPFVIVIRLLARR